ncbi:uncharacterized protein ColSpa_09128 [Colletotrichum spaethianum]|uniref:Zn(2)-C6 fungal-type domain-containing protein n=1 Tax=Colletotrichum spaethianum TaxID=700344 RepID=A0AA37UQL2_9PEZI|nr:uncharacterized protein ColSpa_09128 [Colletotrichum spaethianum]GKT48947.1 hypothetical protein ColSpa_09128 [Colletotrichum spaethianum]
MSTNLRPLRPRGQASDDKSTLDANSSKGSKGRVACGQCRKLRQKCDTQRPFCGRCLLTKHDCVYEADLGETRMQGIRKANRQLKGEVDTLKSLFELLKSADQEVKADIMAQLAADESPEAIIQRLKDGEGASRKPKVGSCRETSETDRSRNSTQSINGFVKSEEDDEPPLPPGIVPWQIDKMHYLLHRVDSIDINAKSTDPQSRTLGADAQGFESAEEDQEQKSPELLHALILADQAAQRRSKSSSAESLPLAPWRPSATFPYHAPYEQTTIPQQSRPGNC